MSVWTRPHRVRVARLEAEGRLEAPVVPDDLATAFAAHPGSRAAIAGAAARGEKARG